MSRKIEQGTGGIANSFATKTLVVANWTASHIPASVQSQQTRTANTHAVPSLARTFACARNTRLLLKNK